MEQCTVYLLKNTVNGKVYVGQTWQTLNERWKNGAGYKNCVLLQRALDKYGPDNFLYEVVGLASSQENADYLEVYFIEFYHSLDRKYGYNLKTGGSNGKPSEETRQKLSTANLGKTLSSDHRQKISDAHKGKTFSPEHIKNMSLGNKKLGIRPPSALGRKHSQEVKGKISEAMSNRIVSPETKDKLSKIMKGRDLGKCKLPLEQCIEIQNSELSSRQLAKIYSVGKTTINMIRKRNNQVR